jgi:hypothetical protein
MNHHAAPALGWNISVGHTPSPRGCNQGRGAEEFHKTFSATTVE